MSDLILYMLLIFVCYRFSGFFVYDRGPFGIFAAVRRAAGVAASQFERGLFFEIAEGLNCVHCVGVWVAFPLAFIPSPESVLKFFVIWLGLAGSQSFLYSLMRSTDAT